MADDLMNAYQQEQLEALLMIRQRLQNLDAFKTDPLAAMLGEYHEFRSRTADFLETRFGGICTEKCYRDRRSACCSKDGIITFFADMVINALAAGAGGLERMESAIRRPPSEVKCIYLSESGCVWRIKPIVCEFFLCDEAEKQVFANDPEAQRQWEELKVLKNSFTWPDRPVLFEAVESVFIDRGCRSSLMYLHTSPGLVRLKRLRNARADTRPA
ncbi:MAG: hypothetical protein ACOZF0_04995 [Thermodesulfobacteriota bacterium]